MGRKRTGPKRGMRLSDEHFRLLQVIGDGNASRGVRVLIELQVAMATEVLRREQVRVAVILGELKRTDMPGRTPASTVAAGLI